MRLVRLGAAALAATFVAVLAGGPALAHNSLVEAVPKKNAELAEAPDEIRLTFLQKLDARFMTIVVTDAGKQKIAADEPEADGKTGTLSLGQPLANGAYTVAYRVVSQDGHPVQGSYTFTVADKKAVAAPSASADPVAEPEPEPEPVALVADRTPRWLAAAGAVGLVLVAAIAAFVWRRHRRSTVTD